MKISVKEPPRPATKVIIEMTDKEAVVVAECLRVLIRGNRLHPVTRELADRLIDLTNEW